MMSRAILIILCILALALAGYAQNIAAQDHRYSNYGYDSDIPLVCGQGRC